jgi:polyhydroxyalkanoate synthesis regulator phasin
MSNGTIRMIDPHGGVHDVPTAKVDDAAVAGFSVESDAQALERIDREVVAERNAGVGNTVMAGVQAGISAGTLGAYDAAMRALGGDSYSQYRKEQTEAHPVASMVGGAVGSVVAPVGGIGRLAKGGEATSAIGGVVRAGRGAAAEGTVLGAGAGVSELAISDKPLDIERVASVLSSHMLFGGAVGGAAGSVGKLAEIGLVKARGALAARESRAVVDDLAGMDAKQLRAARQGEVDAIKESHKLEIEALETTRKIERQSISDDIAALRREIKDSNQWATTKGVKLPALEGKMSAAELGRVAAKAEKQLANVLDNPIGLAKNPAKALDALQRQESALVKLLEHADDLKVSYAADGLGGRRLAALDAAPKLLERNRTIQARIGKTMEPHPSVPTSSPRLEAIEAARDALAGGGRANPLASVPQRMTEGTVFGTVAGAIGALPIPGAAMAAPLLGAAVAKMAGERLFGGLTKAASEQARHASKIAQAFLGKAERATRAAVPIASKVLAGVRYGEADRGDRPKASESVRGDLGKLYAQRASEVRRLVEPGPDGKAVMREDARAKVAERLAPIGTQFPMLADALEEIAARRATFLADRLPRKPDAFAYQLGPDKWQPSDMDMRKWARYVAGVEDPGSIMDRVVDGSVSPEDAEVMREVYPEMLADLQHQILEQGSSATKAIPYQRRLALSRLTGIPVDASMEPGILRVLQASFSNEEGTEGGTQEPRAQPQFGSVSRSLPEPTPAQRRSA